MRKILSWGSAFDGDRAGAFVVWQTVVLVLLATWSLGGRADGAIFWIGAVCWGSLLAVALDPGRRTLLPVGRTGSVLLASWAVVFLFLLIAPLNPQLAPVEAAGGARGLRPLDPVLWLPSALVAYRSAEYGLLLSGAMVQSLMLWHYLRSRRQVRHLLTALALNALVLAVAGAWFKLTGADKILGLAEPVNERFFASFRYHNHWVAFTLLSMGQCAALMVEAYGRGLRDPRTKKRRPEVFWLCALVLTSITLPMCGSRTGILFFAFFWFAALVSGLFFVTRAAGEPAAFIRPWMRSAWFRAGTVTALVLAVAGYVALVSGDEIREHYTETRESMQEYHERYHESEDLDFEHSLYAFRGILADRLIYSWVDTGNMLGGRPLLGWGFGSHKYAFYFFTGDHYRDADGFPRVHKEFAHNDWMQFPAELGLVAFTALLLVPVVQAARLRRRAPAPPFSRPLLFTAGLVLVIALFEFPLSNPAVLVLFFVQATAALGYWRRSVACGLGDRRQGSGGRGQGSGVRGPGKIGDRSQGSGIRGPGKIGGRDQESGVRGPGEDRGQEAGIRNQETGEDRGRGIWLYGNTGL